MCANLPTKTALALALALVLTGGPPGAMAIFDYCNKAQCEPGTHSACGGCMPAQNVRIMETTPKFRTAILDEHNKIRNLVASGRNTSSGLVPAADMLALSYDMGLEFTISCWMYKHGAMDHDQCRNTERFVQCGQNLMYGNVHELDTEEMYRNAPWTWFADEVEYFTPNEIDNYTDTTLPKPAEIGHLTALLWSDTRYVGCALCVINRGEETYMVGCNYHPGGNVVGWPMYKRGPPASKCPKGMKPNTQYPALCGDVEPMPALAMKVGHPEIREVLKGTGVFDNVSRASLVTGHHLHRERLLKLCYVIFSLLLFCLRWRE